MMAVAPKWTERILTPKSGRDHLGVGSVVTDQILPDLSPGINVLTPHPRYWSFYALVVDEYWKSQPSSASRRGLLEYLGRRESIFSIAGHLCPNPDHRSDQNPVGSQAVRPLVAEQPRKYRSDFKYVKSLGGGYRLYYATVMQAMGVIRLAEPEIGLPADAVTPDRGVELAEAFRESISGTRYWKNYWNADTVPADVVEEYAAAACLCRLRADSPDRAPIADTFMYGFEWGAKPETAAKRRDTVRMMLEISHQTRDVPLNQEGFRRLLLFQVTGTNSEQAGSRAFNAPADLLSVLRRWRLSQLREMFNYSLNGMWSLLTEWGLESGGDYSPLPIKSVLGLASSLDFSAVPGMDQMSPRARVSEFVAQVRSEAQVTDSLDDAWPLDATLTEDGLQDLLENADLSDGQRWAVQFTLYVLCLVRLWDEALPASVEPRDWGPVRDGGANRVSLNLALGQLRHDEQTGTTVGESFTRVLEFHVLRQHQRVAVSKLPDDTFRYRQERDRVRFFQKSTDFTLNDTRFNALATVCAELNWSGSFDESPRILSPEGETIRATGHLPNRQEQA